MKTRYTYGVWGPNYTTYRELTFSTKIGAYFSKVWGALSGEHSTRVKEEKYEA